VQQQLRPALGGLDLLAQAAALRPPPAPVVLLHDGARPLPRRPTTPAGAARLLLDFAARRASTSRPNVSLVNRVASAARLDASASRAVASASRAYTSAAQPTLVPPPCSTHPRTPTPAPVHVHLDAPDIVDVAAAPPRPPTRNREATVKRKTPPKKRGASPLRQFGPPPAKRARLSRGESDCWLARRVDGSQMAQ
jgi:hypothetical protein